MSRVCDHCTEEKSVHLIWLSALPMFDPVLETEAHVISECSSYDEERSQLGAKTLHSLTSVELLSDAFEDKAQLQNLARFLQKVWKKRFAKKKNE